MNKNVVRQMKPFAAMIFMLLIVVSSADVSTPGVTYATAANAPSEKLEFSWTDEDGFGIVLDALESEDCSKSKETLGDQSQLESDVFIDQKVLYQTDDKSGSHTVILPDDISNILIDIQGRDKPSAGYFCGLLAAGNLANGETLIIRMYQDSSEIPAQYKGGTQTYLRYMKLVLIIFAVVVIMITIIEAVQKRTMS